MDGMAHRARFAAAMTAITRRLPFGLSEVVAPSLVGYLLINLCTFFIDLGLLGLFHGTFGWPIPAAVTLSYGTASATSYVLNRVLELPQPRERRQAVPRLRRGQREQLPDLRARPHRPAVAAGVYYELSRVIAACCEAVYLYCMMRWVVFRDADTADAGPLGRRPGRHHRPRRRQRADDRQARAASRRHSRPRHADRRAPRTEPR